jgi:hypothetical protein
MSNTKHHTKGKPVNITEQHTKTPRRATGLFALLGALLCIAGSGASAALPATASAYATAGGPPIFSSAPGLPDSRVYEQVSPADKNGNEAGAGTAELPDTGENHYSYAAPNGDSVLFEGTGPIGETADAYDQFFVATRTSGGWHTRGALPGAQESGAELGGTVGASLDSLDPSQDLSHVMFTSKRGIYSAPPYPECGEVGEGQTYLAGSDPFVVATWLNRPEISDPIGACGSGPVGGTPDFSTVYFTFPGTLLPEDSSRIEGGGFYEDAEGTLREAGFLPGGGLSPFGASAATSPGRNEVSTEPSPGAPAGSRVFFVSPEPASCEPAGHNDCATDPPELYVRENGDRTQLVSQDTLLPDVGGLPAPAPADPEGSAASFAFASADGSQAFFQSEDDLTKAAEKESPGPEPKTYDFDVNTGELMYLPGVVGEIMASDTEGTSVAFVKPEAGGKPPELDLWSGPGGGSVTPITQIPGAELISRTYGNPPFSRVSLARMSSDGSVVVFTSAYQIPGAFNSGTEIEQIYRYDVPSNTLGCVSCTPAGVTPTGNAVISQPTAGHGDQDPGMVEARGISADGDRIFFDTPDPLVPQDVNTRAPIYNNGEIGKEFGRDVYEWENGVIYLISSGKSTHNSYVLDNSANGGDVFFATTEGLVPGDTDGGYDVYDARVPQPGDNPPPAAVPCEGSVCQGPPNVPSPLTPPASVTFSGLGNPTPQVTPPPPPVKKTTTKTVKCKKNYVKKNNKCVRKAKPKKAKKSAHINRRASR